MSEALEKSIYYLAALAEYDEKVMELRDELRKYKDLEEQIGCPLEVRCKITTDTTVFDKEGRPFDVSFIHDNYFVAVLDHPFCTGYALDFAYSDYKITWWLEPDKSE